MPRLGLINMIIGFLAIFIAACGGAFNAYFMTEGFVRDPEILKSWTMVLQNSSHGHTNLFGMLHILFGLTIPYSGLSLNIKKWQTLGLFCGVLAMGPGMLIKAGLAPQLEFEWVSFLLGILLSLAMLALISHVAGLFIKQGRRG